MTEPKYSEKNPLAELAEELDFNHFPRTCSKRQDAALLKAQRIITELAKVRINSFGWPYDDGEAYSAIGKCRAIAAEGANNG